MEETLEYAAERQRMVDEQLATRDIRSQRVLDAMRAVPRHRFVPPDYVHMAYADGPLPIGEGQTISQPYIVALMTQLLQLEADDTVLEIGTGSGYQAAVLARLARQVYTIERHQPLADQASQALADLGIDNVQIQVGDGSPGWPENGPYNAIMVTAAAPEVPPPLKRQLADGGRLVIPVGGYNGQTLRLVRRRGARYEREYVVPVAFVPLRGEHGWGDSEWKPA